MKIDEVDNIRQQQTFCIEMSHQNILTYELFFNQKTQEFKKLYLFKINKPLISRNKSSYIYQHFISHTTLVGHRNKETHKYHIDTNTYVNTFRCPHTVAMNQELTSCESELKE